MSKKLTYITTIALLLLGLTATAQVKVGGHVFGGGNAANVSSKSTVIINQTGATVDGDVYGGGALANVGTSASDITTVDIFKGTINGNVYGGGLGDSIDNCYNGSSNTAALVHGKVYVNIGDNNGGPTLNGSVFGCNNINGTPLDDVFVNIYKTAHTTDDSYPNSITSLQGLQPTFSASNYDDFFAIEAVYGGGNKASYKPAAGKTTTVHVYECNENTIKTIYGGGNAADVGTTTKRANTSLIIEGGRYDQIFGGGNGYSETGNHDNCSQPNYNPGANITGTASTEIRGGLYRQVFGGSNQYGDVNNAALSINKTCDDLVISEAFGGANEAVLHGSVVTNLGCGDYEIGSFYGGSNKASIDQNVTLNVYGGTYTNIFGGSKGVAASGSSTGTAANIGGNVTLNLFGGTMTNAFGGSDKNGNISGSITLNVLDLEASNCGLDVNNIYGASNETAYSPTEPTITSPVVNVMHIAQSDGVKGNVFGGGNLAAVTANPKVNIGYVSSMSSYITAIAAYLPTNYAVPNNARAYVTGKVFGGGNEAGVTNTEVNINSGNVLAGVYGGCNTSGTVSGNIAVNLTGGTVGASDARADVFGGGYGSSTLTSGNIAVNFNGTTVYGDLYGGSALGSVNSATANPANTTTLTINGSALHGTIYGGGKGDNSTTAVSNGNVLINYTTANTSLTGLYGGANVNGNVKGDITLNVLANVGATGNGNSINVFGGGLGHLTNTEGNVTVNVGAADGSNNPVIYGDIYGGSALGNVNNATADLTTVNILNGTVHGNVYGGGLGAATLDGNGYIASVTTEAIVNGTVHVNIGDASNTNSTPTIDGKVFGCNNLAGSPKGHVYVDVYRTAHTTANTYPTEPPTSASAIPDNPAANSFAISEVYGGGNLAHYTTTLSGASTHVRIHNCDNTIQYVYGGGNAANTVANEVTIDGGRFEYVFGGGNGAGTGNPGANVVGDATVNINGGIINYVFGGSNTLGVVNGVSSMTFATTPSCTRMVKELYGGGNMAPGGTVDMTIPCGVTGLNVVFGGSRNADIGTETLFNGGTKKNVTLTIEGGNLTQVFGGNNQGGTIWGDVTLNLKGGTIVDAFGGNNAGGNVKGIITVNVEEDESLACPLVLTNVFGGGKDAAYTPASATISSPLVYIKHKKSSTSITGSVFGGGQGSTATVTAKPVVTIGDLTTASYIATIDGDVYGGGDAADVVGTTTVLVQKCNTVINGDVYGGGNAADVDATSVTVTGGTINGTGHGMVFGGGHGDKNSNPQKEANVNGDVAVDITGGTINKVFGGSNSKGNISGTVAVNIAKGANSCQMHITEVYGGGNEAAGNAGTLTIGCTGDYENNGEGITNVYGGANAADIGNSINLTIRGGHIDNVYGGNNTSGSISGTIAVTVNWDNTLTCSKYLGNVFGGGNQAVYTAPSGSQNYPEVKILNGLVSGDVFGGGLGLSGDPTKGVVNGNPQVTVNGSGASVNGGVYGGGSLAPTVGNPVVTLTTGALTKVFGGGKAADVTGAPTVNINGGTVSTGVYGGCDSQGSVSGKITVNVTNGTIGDPSINLTSPNYITADVFGGGYGQSTNTAGNVEVNFGTTATSHNDFPKLYGNVYGGSALGNVNKDGNNTTIVNILNGTLYTTATTGTTANGLTYYVYHGGNVFGGGLGDRANLGTGHSDVAAQVKGKVTVNIGSASNTKLNPDEDLNGGFAIIQGNVYGSNNTNGSPQDNVTVNIYRTERGEKDQITYTGNDATYALNNVFGGGNEADYTATGKTASVNIFGCYNSIYRVFGGGNAAAAPNVHTTIQGGRFAEVFGGGNGERGAAYAANITGNVNLEIHGGIVGEFYVGSNQNGAISGTSSVVVDQTSGCEEVSITEFYCGGKYADFVGNIEATITCSDNMNVTNLYGGCKEANVVAGNGGSGNVHLIVKGGTYENVYGGSRGKRGGKAADIQGNITLDLYGGTMENVYGGSNENGNIAGTITVNIIDEEGSCPLNITNIYGGSNETDYTPSNASAISPVVNLVHIKNGVQGNVYGGSRGLSGANPPTKVVSCPQVNIGYNSSMTLPSSYNLGNYSLKTNIQGNVYGGGDAAKVEGNTKVIVNGANQ